MYKHIVKRLLDMFFSLLMLPILLITTMIVGILIKLEDDGPIFYSGNRVGKNSSLFKMYKFRTMKVASSIILTEDGSTYNSENDERLTKIGKYLREKSIDELPQIFNVLKGEMSIVGPRASMEIALPSYKEDEMDKMKVKPGITGFTQAYYRNSISNRSKRLKDAWYANNVSLSLDIKIIVKTVKTVLKSDNIYMEK